MPPPKMRGAGSKASKKDAPATKDALFNKLKKDLDKTIRWAGMVAEDEEGATESLDKAAEQLYASARTFATRPDDLQLKSTQDRPQSLHLTDDQRLHVRKLYQEVQEAIQRNSENQKSGKMSDHSKDLPALKGFIKAFGLDDGEEQEEVFWLPKKRTPFPGGPPPEEVLDEDEEMAESDFEVPEIEGLINLKRLPLHSFEEMGGFKAALKR